MKVAPWHWAVLGLAVTAGAFLGLQRPPETEATAPQQPEPTISPTDQVRREQIAPRGPTLVTAPFPEAVAGFRFGDTREQFAARCVAARGLTRAHPENSLCSTEAVSLLATLGATAEHVEAYFWNDRLSNVTLAYGVLPEASFQRMQALLSAKYGAPTIEKDKCTDLGLLTYARWLWPTREEIFLSSSCETKRVVLQYGNRADVERQRNEDDEARKNF